MRRYIVFLLITGTVWAQTGLDKLVLKNGTEYFGEYSKVEDKEVYFKPNNALDFQAVPLELIETLKLKNGTVLIQSGRINESTLSFKKFSNEYEKLTIEEKADYNRKKRFILLAVTATFGVFILIGLARKPLITGDFYFGP